MHDRARVLLLLAVTLMASGAKAARLDASDVAGLFSAATTTGRTAYVAAADSSAPAPRPPRRRPKRKAATPIRTGIILEDDHNRELSGELWYGRPGKPGIAQKMMRDVDVRRSVAYVHDPICASRPLFLAGGPQPVDQEAADLLQLGFIERLPWRKYVQRMVRGYAASGFALEEMTDDYVPISTARFPLHPGGGQAILPTGFHDVPAWSVARFHPSTRDASKLHRIEQFVTGSDVEEPGFSTLYADRLLRLTYDQEGAKFTGEAVLRPAYAPWKLKLAFQTIDAIKHERTGAGTPSITLPEDADKEDIEIAEEILAEMRVNEKGFLVLRHGYVFKWEGASESDSSNLEAALARCRVDIAMNVGAGFMHLGLTGRASGSFALGGTQQGAYHLVVDGHAAFIAEAINLGSDGWSPVERLVRLNYGPDVALPRLAFRNLPTRDWLKIAEVVTKLVLAKVVRPDARLEDAVRTSMDLPAHEPETARDFPVSLGTPPAAPPAGPAPDGEDDPEEPESADGGGEREPAEKDEEARA